jgi:hypothetical protein
MWYTGGMQTRAQCSCGWQLELSQFYAGKQLRCPQCERIVSVPGESTTPLYGSKLPQRAGPGEWRPVRYSACTRGACRGNGTFLMVMAIVIAVTMLNQCRGGELPWQKAPPADAQPTRPAPDAQEKEQDF